MIQVEISNRQTEYAIDDALLQRAVAHVLRSEQITAANISLCVVDDPAIHQLNRQFLDHDYPTDVLSFVYQQEPLEGEVIVSAQRAYDVCQDFAWDGAHELLLYVVHGSLHLAGYLDDSPENRAVMRRRESEVLADLGYRRGDADVEDSSCSPERPVTE